MKNLNKKKRSLVVLTNSFPYGDGEKFLDTEKMYFKDRFDEIYYLPCCCLQEFYLHKQENTLLPDKPILKYLEFFRVPFKREFYKEIKFLFKMGKLELKTIKSLAAYIITGYNFRCVNNKLKKLEISRNDLVFYSYWMTIPAYTATLFKREYKNCKCITRCHGIDLYEFRHRKNYLPLRRHVFQNLDEIYCISCDGIRYLEEKYPEFREKFKLSRLGTINTNDFNNKRGNRDTFKIVSCSSVIEIKRIDRIIDALSEIREVNLEWTHFGDGKLLCQIQNYAEEKLPANIRYNFMGFFSNTEVMEFYKTNEYDLFINTSETEGIPVSIMEAMSFGIPVVATDVGGTKEIVIDRYNGRLLKKNFQIRELNDLIFFFLEMNKITYQQYARNAYSFWLKYFNAERNYKKFIRDISENKCESSKN